MSHTAGHGPYAREHPRAWVGREVEEIPQGWKDDMVRRQLEECNSQMIRLQNATRKTPERDVDEKRRAADARTLSILRREMKELLLMDDDRIVKRDARKAQQSDNAIAELERRLDQLLERERQAGVARIPHAGSRGETE